MLRCESGMQGVLFVMKEELVNVKEDIGVLKEVVEALISKVDMGLVLGLGLGHGQGQLSLEPYKGKGKTGLGWIGPTHSPRVKWKLKWTRPSFEKGSTSATGFDVMPLHWLRESQIFAPITPGIVPSNICVGNLELVPIEEPTLLALDCASLGEPLSCGGGTDPSASIFWAAFH